jgi:hypothetical protein
MQGGGSRLAEDVQEGSDARGRRGARRQGGGGDRGSGDTGTSDPTYGLVSTAYHPLQGAETIQQYMDDAKREGDRELLKFLRQVHRSYVKNAEGAKHLLSQRLTAEARGS